MTRWGFDSNVILYNKLLWSITQTSCEATHIQLAAAQIVGSSISIICKAATLLEYTVKLNYIM